MLHAVLTGGGIHVHAADRILDEGRHLLRVVVFVTAHVHHYTPLGYLVKSGPFTPALDWGRSTDTTLSTTIEAH
jgi:hypothetical protein